ncbi:3-hydroxyisobutyrate dehydrogenase [Amycolatopsis arida]|uniref:3-hydroxyisobutyrate dehydrogenase n=1 Tax=Amycolatopsis arida TaxID=587909 RepID=A0A1I5ZGG8_9PSEU|nr:NAD(P)-binding domain-containing protein [Amycolatopsis arida]TDX89626.1 3-hydroxyisobutyrate dehydrogenase-like beta-hydroxyacid dehydrogenase [Amycolatopsis arida]SFQ55207.1 3-hydroxyisobutyrate dehydrogenase [Amycolatopsis arida]
MTDSDRTPVTVLGLGAMGTALAEALLAAGHPTTVWNRTRHKAEPLVARGARPATDVADAIAASRLVIVCLLDHASVHATLDGHAERVRGRALVNLTSGTPAQAEELAAWAAAHGADHLDGGIMAVPTMIGSREAFVLYSGSRHAFQDHRAVLEVLAETHYLGEEPGRAAVHDVALLSGMYGMFMGVLQSFAVIRTEGVPATTFAPLLGRWLSAMAGFVDGAARQIDEGDYTLDVSSSLAMQAGAFAELLHATEERGISTRLLAPLGRLLDRRVADGHGDEDITGVLELLTLDHRKDPS